MNIIPSIFEQSLSRDKNLSLTILLIDNEREDFINFLKPLGHKFIRYEHLYLGSELPNMLLCNNKVSYYEIAKQVSITYHIPSIIIDHVPKSNIYNEDKLKFLDNLPSSFRVATSIQIHKSWHSIHDRILPYGKDTSFLEAWYDFLLEVALKGFHI